MKIGRNALCPCGSGKKYKRCCGGIEERPSTSAPHVFNPKAMHTLWAREAAEKVRQQQQGYGRPIISFESHGYRIVAVGNRIYWNSQWKIFPDFLMDHMKEVLGRKWGERESRNPNNNHPIFVWLKKFQEYRTACGIQQGKLKSAPATGFTTAVNQLAYALYLIAHHDQLPKPLIRRLREPMTFLPAYYETMAGAAFAVAGFEIKSAESKKSHVPTPEFWADSKASGQRYAIEAKRKETWKALAQNTDDEAFQNELKRYIERELFSASKKNLDRPVFWFELNIPWVTDEADWQRISLFAESVIRNAERQIGTSAYIFITNHTFLANLDVVGSPFFAFIDAVNIPDFNRHGPIDLEMALAAYDKHRDLHQVMETLKIVYSIPVTFDGSPEHLLDQNGDPTKPLQIGDKILAPNAEGNEVPVEIEDIASMGEKAFLIVRDADKQTRSIINVPLTSGEKQAVQKYGDAVFGKANSGKHLEGDDLYGLYNWMLHIYAGYSKEQLLGQIPKHRLLSEYEKLSLKDLRVRVARELTKHMYADAQRRRLDKDSQDNKGQNDRQPNEKPTQRNDVVGKIGEEENG